MFDAPTTKPNSIVEIGENSKSRNFFIHRAWTKAYYQSPKTDIENIIFEFSYINKLGNIDPVKTQIDGKALHSMLVSCNLRKRPIFLYDKTPYKNVNQDLSFMTPNANYNHFGSQSQPFTHSQEGFHDFIDRHYHSQFSQTGETRQ